MLDRVIEIASHHTGLPVAKLSATSAIDQDIRISGDDVTELAEARWPRNLVIMCGSGLGSVSRIFQNLIYLQGFG